VERVLTQPQPQSAVPTVPRVFSGIQPTGLIHLGNYVGALRQWVELQRQYESYFCIVDLHAITVPYEPAELQQRILEAAAANLAAGIDPQRSVLFVQSHVPEHTELMWLLNTITPVGQLERMTQYKEKARRSKHGVMAGLLNYPVLQAADVLLYKATLVPVGKTRSSTSSSCGTSRSASTRPSGRPSRCQRRACPRGPASWPSTTPRRR
jgi:tryptophanyl-tRNA synthetase